MTIYLGENIKRLRREKELTQEKLAEFLGVTFQSISNWERGESYPDISMLPEIAGFFRVSIDDLLGMSKAQAQQKIDEYLNIYDTMRFKDTHFVFTKFEQAVKDFPADFRILVRYMELLMCEKTSKDNPGYENMSREVLSVYDNIQNHCTDDNIRMWAKRLACEHLHTKSYFAENEEYQTMAEEILAEMPEMINTKDYLSTFLISDIRKHYEACSNLIENLIFMMNNTVSHYCIYDDNFNAEYKIEAVTKMIDICNMIFNDGNYGRCWQNMIYNHGHLVRFFAETGNFDNALKNLALCAETAKKYDNLQQTSERQAQFFEGMHYEKIQRGSTMCQRMKSLITEKYPLPDTLKQTDEFKQIIDSL